MEGVRFDAYDDSNFENSYNKYKSNYLIVESDSFGYSNKYDNWGIHQEKKIVSLDEYKKMKKEKEKVIVLENENKQDLEL